MYNCSRMRSHVVALIGVILASSAFAGARVVVPSLPEPMRSLAEIETNVVFSTGAATDNKWTLTIERDSACSRRLLRFLACLKPHFPASKIFYDLRLDLRFVWYNGCELNDMD